MKNLTPTPIVPQLDFAPVPRKYRYDGWTPERQRGFIAALAETGSVKAACRRINMSVEGAYYLRRQPGADAFHAAWAAALDHGVQNLTDIAIDRAIEGVPVPVFYKGEQVGEKRWFNDRLLMFVLKHHLPGRYNAPALANGTRHPDTIAREAAENCPVCKERVAAAEAEGAPPSEGETAERLAVLNDMMGHYRKKLMAEHRYRVAGDFAGADFTLRQLTHLELILVHGGRTMELIDAATNPPDVEDPGDAGNLFANPLSAALDDLRRDYWEKHAAPPRPRIDFPETTPTAATWGGPTAAERTAARTAAEKRIAEAQAEWRAAASEEGWKAWKGERGCGRFIDR